MAIGGRVSGLLTLGDEVTWRAKHFGVWQTLSVRITAYERPRYFRDVMIQGSFAKLDHEHTFEADGTGGTLMRDRFEFAAPFGFFGQIVERLALTGYMRRLLLIRNHAIKSMAESNEWQRFVS